MSDRPDPSVRPDAVEPGAAEPDGAEESESAWARRRRLDAVFGDVLPETTSDEREEPTTADGEDAGERWLRSQVPPHHG
jgi:hypothetical protein